MIHTALHTQALVVPCSHMIHCDHASEFIFYEAMLQCNITLILGFVCRLFQLTWLSGKTYFYDVNNFANSTMQYDPLTDGWGATTDGRYLIVSDGSANISFLDPNTLQKVKSIAVNDNGKAVPMLNEVRAANRRHAST